MIFNTDVVNGEWRDTSVATNVCANNLQEEVDNDAIKKAEIKYEHDLDVLNQKDTEFDTELSNLETERAAIAKELDAIANVRKENIDRTFGIFS